MSLFTCEKCGRKSEMNFDGLCRQCDIERQNEVERRKIVDISMPSGVIARWSATPSFLDKKNNYMYFRIPPSQALYFDPNKQYDLIVKEVDA